MNIFLKTVASCIVGTLLMVDFAYAQTTISGVIESFTNLFGLFIAPFVAIAVIVFFWGIVLFIKDSGDEKNIEAGKKRMIWGIFGLFVLVSIWGIVGFIGNIFGVGQGGTCSVSGMNADGVYNCFIDPITGGAL